MRNLLFHIALVLLAIFFIIPSCALSIDFEKYFEYYDHELERSIAWLEYAGSYEEYRSRMELSFNILNSLWERDLSEFQQDLHHDLFSEWHKSAEERIAKATTEYLVRSARPDEKRISKIKEELTRRLPEISLIRTDDKGEQFQNFQQKAVTLYNKEIEELELIIDEEYNAIRNALVRTLQNETPYLDTALEREKQGLLYEKKVFLSSLLNSYANRVKYELFADRDSLKHKMEETGAKKIADELQEMVKDELEKSVETRLNSLLEQGTQSITDLQELSKTMKVLYERGLEIWADAAAELVRKENEWYTNYDEVYSEGVSAWTHALDTLKVKKTQWNEQFFTEVQTALENWDAVFEDLNKGREQLLSSLIEFKEAREADFDIYFNQLESTLSLGTERLSQIEQYIDEFDIMIKDTLHPLTQRELDDSQVLELIDFLKRYSDNPEGFWYQDKPLDKLFELKTTSIRISDTPKKDEIISGPCYYLLSSTELDDGFKLKVEAQAKVRRYRMMFTYNGYKHLIHTDCTESRFFSITCTYGVDGTWRRTVTHTSDCEGGFRTPVSMLNVSSIAQVLQRYSGIKHTLHDEKREIVESVRGVQVAVLDMINDNESILDCPEFTSEEMLHDYYIADSKEVLLDGLDKEFTRAYFEKIFWKRQSGVIEEVLDYAFNKSEREDAQSTISLYKEAKERYKRLVEEYEWLLEGEGRSLTWAETRVTELAAQLESLTTELSEKEELLQLSLARLSGLKFAEGDIHLLVLTLLDQFEKQIETKHSRLQRIWGFDEYEKEEALQNLLKLGLENAELQYEKILDEYFDPDSPSSLLNIERHQMSFFEALKVLFPQTDGTISSDSVSQVASAVKEIGSEMTQSEPYGQLVWVVENLYGKLNGLAGLNENLTTSEILSHTLKDIYLILRMLQGLIDAKTEAYYDFYAHSDDPRPFLRDEWGKYAYVYVSDAEQYAKECIDAVQNMQSMISDLSSSLHETPYDGSGSGVYTYITEKTEEYTGRLQDEVLSLVKPDFQHGQWAQDLEPIVRKCLIFEKFLQRVKTALDTIQIPNDAPAEDIFTTFAETVAEDFQKEKAYWEGVQDALKDGNRSFDELILNEDYYSINKRFLEVLPEIFLYDMVIDFKDSLQLSQKNEFYTNLLPYSSECADFQKAFIQEVSEGVKILDKIYFTNIDLFERLTEQIDQQCNFSDQQSTPPLKGNLNREILSIFLYIDELQKNELTKTKVGFLMKGMADYIASSIYLAYLSDFEEIVENDEEWDAFLKERIDEYFNSLKALSTHLGFTDEEINKITTHMNDELISEGGEENSAFMNQIERKIVELINGQCLDYRGVFYDLRDVIPDFKECNLDTDLREINIARGYRCIDDPKIEKMISNIYFEGFGELLFEDKNSGKMRLNSAITYISPDSAANSYIEYQNRFIQSLGSLLNIREISEEEALRYFKENMILEQADENSPDVFIDLNIFSGSGSDYANIDTINAQELEDIKAILSSLSSHITVADSDAMIISKGLFTENDLFENLSFAREIGKEKGDIGEKLRLIQAEIDEIKNGVRGVDALRLLIQSAEEDLYRAREDYNTMIQWLNEKKKELDEAYYDYLTAKEKYFYAQNYYESGDDVLGSVQAYGAQLQDYAGKSAVADEKYRILKDIKMRSGVISEGDELNRLYERLSGSNESLNRTQMALQLLTVFVHLYEIKLESLEGKKRFIDERLNSEECDENYAADLIAMKEDIELKISALRDIDKQYSDFRFISGTTVNDIMLSGLLTGAAIDQKSTDEYLMFFNDFMENEGKSIFIHPFHKSLNMMIVELKDCVGQQQKERAILLEEIQRKYCERYNNYIENTLSTYLDYVGELATHRTEYDFLDRKISFLRSTLSEEEKRKYAEYVAPADVKDIDEKYSALIQLERRKTQLRELILVHEILLDIFDRNTLTENEKDKWGEDLEVLKEKYGIKEKAVPSYNDIVREGLVLDLYDFSNTGLLKEELRRKKELFDRIKQLDYYNTITGCALYDEIMVGTRVAYNKIGEDRAALQVHNFDLQSTALIEEKNRFNQKALLGKEKGLYEWDKLCAGMQGEYRKWFSEMREIFNVGEREWQKKEVQYVIQRDKWIRAVMENGELKGKENLHELEEKIEGLTADISTATHTPMRRREDFEKRLNEEIPMPRWITNYEVAANCIFGYLKKTNLTSSHVEKSIEQLKERVRAFADKRESYEIEKLYFKLNQVKEMILTEIYQVDNMNRMMIEDVLKEAGFNKKGNGYEKRFLVDYSLLGGKKKETRKIGLFSSYSIDERKFTLPDVEVMRRLEDNADRQIFLFRESERLRREKDGILGNSTYVGDIYKKHIGRFPTNEDLKRYIEEKQVKKGLFGGLKKLFSKVLDCIASLFRKKKDNSKEQDFSAFQKRLVKEIQYPQNKELETGRILLEYQRLEVVQAQAKEKANSGFFNAPLFPGGPSLKSIGSVALSITTGGAGLAGTLSQVGWNTFTTGVTALEGKIDLRQGVLDVSKNMMETWITGGFSKSGIGIAELSLKNLGSLSNRTGGATKLSLYEAKKHLINQVAGSTVNAFEIDSSGTLGWNSTSFSNGVGFGLLSSAGKFGGSFVGHTYDIRHGATWDGRAYNYNYMKDTVNGGFIADYYNTDMKRLGRFLGGVTEQGINNVTGVQEGFTFNVLNSRDFGHKHEVGMIMFALGSDGSFDWDVSTEGINISPGNIVRTVQGSGRVKLFNEVLYGEDRGLKIAYVADNKLRYSFDTLSEIDREQYMEEYDRALADVGGYLKGSAEIIFDFSSDTNRRYDDVIFIKKNLVDDADVLNMDLNKAAKLVSLISHELMHEREDIENKIREDIEAHGFDTVVWKGLKDRFGVYNNEMDEKLLVYESFGNVGFEEYLNNMYELGIDANKPKGLGLKTRLTLMEGWMSARALLNSPVSGKLLTYYSLLKGFEEKADQWVKAYDDEGIISRAQRQMLSILDKGYELLGDDNGLVKKTDVLDIDFGNTENVDGYVFLSQMRSREVMGDGIILSQRYGIEHDDSMNKEIKSDYFIAGYSGFGEQRLSMLMDTHIEKFINLLGSINKPSVLSEVLMPQYSKLQRSLRKGNTWLSPSWLRGEFQIYDENASYGLCNIGSANILKYLGYDRYYGDKYSGIAHKTKNPKNGMEMYATEMIEDLKELSSFVSIDQVIDLNKIATAEELEDKIRSLNNFSIVTMKNYTGGHSHISVMIGGQSFDVNYKPTSEYGSVDLWVTLGGKSKIKNVFEAVLNYGTFDFKEKWLEDRINLFYKSLSKEKATQKAFMDYINDYGFYNYNILIPKYSVSYSMEFEDLWQMINF